MSQPEHRGLVDEIRASRIAASPELRERVLALAAAVPPPPARREVPWRRMALVLVPACLALAVAGALAAGLATSGKERSVAEKRAAVRDAAPPTAFSQEQAAPRPKAAAGTGLPTTPGRAQIYEAELTLRVEDLSAATKRALRLTRSFNGYVRSVDYGAGRERGTATLVLRVPGGSVQEALVRFSALGTILDQQVSIQDVQPQLDARFRRMQAIRDSIAKLQARLENPNLSASERKALEGELVAARRRLVELQREQSRQQRETSFATVSLDLRSATAPAAVPSGQGRIGRALDRSGEILLDELKVAVYVVIVGAPLLVLALLALGATRARRRWSETRLLARP